MDIHQEKWDYTAMLVAENAITQEQCDTLKLSDGMNMFYSDHLASTTIDCINWGWSSWLKAKAQAVPDTYTPIVLALEDVQSKIAKTSFLTMDGENENEVMAVNANELAAYIDELIEAQEPAK